MQTISDQNPVAQKTKELCQTIVEQPEFQGIRRRIDAFFTDEQAQTQFQLLNNKGEMLQHKQQQGLPLSDADIADFEKDRAALLENPVAKGFLDAQQEVQDMQRSLGQYVAKTFELGRMPTDEDLQDGSCGQGCGCH